MTFEGDGYVCKRVFEDRWPVLHVARDRDGAWQFLCGGDEHDDAAQCLLIHPIHMIERDPTLEAIGWLVPGSGATRSNASGEWIVSERAEPEADATLAAPPSAEHPSHEYLEGLRDHVQECPGDAAAWFDLGLAYKRLGRWQESADANLRALEIHSDPEDPAWWNLGIAATALRNWDLARKAWRGYGLAIADGTGPVACAYGLAPVRLPHGETVWGPRIDPARVVIRNIPMDDFTYRWGDIVLHDGVPNGERESNGCVHAVFDVLERWSPSEIPTLRATVRCESDDDSEALIALFESKGFGAEDWTANVRHICKACSEGRPDGHDHPFGTDERARAFGLASPIGLARTLLEEWKVGSPASRDYRPPAFAEL